MNKIVLILDEYQLGIMQEMLQYIPNKLDKLTIAVLQEFEYRYAGKMLYPRKKNKLLLRPSETIAIYVLCNQLNNLKFTDFQRQVLFQIDEKVQSLIER